MRSDLDSGQPVTAKAPTRYVTVRAAGAQYGFDMRDVREVIGVRPITRVFHAPSALAGVTSLRGEILPVIDLGILLGAPGPTDRGSDARIIVVRERTGDRRVAGLLADSLDRIRDEPAAGLGAVPSTVGAARPFVVGVITASPPCSVLDVGGVFDAEQLRGLAGVVEAR